MTNKEKVLRLTVQKNLLTSTIETCMDEANDEFLTSGELIVSSSRRMERALQLISEQDEANNNMDYTEQLIKLSSDLDDYDQPGFDDASLEGLVLSLEGISEEFDDNTTDAEWSLYYQCDARIDVAERYFEEIYAQEARDQESDEWQYESARYFL
jgi:hypothetical protein